MEHGAVVRPSRKSTLNPVYTETMDIKQLIQQYLQEAKMMHLATVGDGKPLVCNARINFIASRQRCLC